ncbi:MAG TPA: alpha-hydroxy acid oxidase [Ottowia sp.]|uniref:alpha-hydroxy acid oxidase n=1 Tax=Ottowia sp. TaxID=1898956 RepID=UPI002BAEF6C2|nr:alpha-hydroxy acid oxidase [Ottowia sp.]HMN21247.1 alpha-hydroxy acid oxidase [Ottowia sp.]
MPDPIVTLADQAAAAQARLDPATWAFFAGGAGDEHTLRANIEAWQELTLWPRVLRPLAGGHTRVRLAGRELAHPILLAPVALQRLAHPEGEWASALAAAAQGAGYVLGTQSSVPLERVAQAVLGDPGRGPLWFQLYWQADRGFNRALVQRAEAAGYEALVLTVDAPVQGMRDAERRAGFVPPPGIRAVHLQDAPLPAAAPDTYCAGVPAHAPGWDDVAWLQAQTRLPLWLKGVLHPLDARQAQALGAAGLIVSNHGGRTLDTTPATATALARVRAAVGAELPLLVDGGIRRGTDVLKAIALGASAVLVGRPVVHALAAGGALAVAQMLRLLRDELEMAMALAGCASLVEAGPQLLASG